MTRYEQGFLTKCAERGLDRDQAAVLLKKAGLKDILRGARDLLFGIERNAAGLPKNTKNPLFVSKQRRKTVSARNREALRHPQNVEAWYLAPDVAAKSGGPAPMSRFDRYLAHNQGANA